MKFELLFAIFSIIFTLKSVQPQNDCFSLIKTLSEKDKCLWSRINLKREKAQLAKNSEQFFQNVLNIPCTGNEFSCGNTMSWVSEVFLGLENQFQESKYDDSLFGALSGYDLAIGDELVKLYELSKTKNDSIIYQMRHTGTEDHVFTIEQLENRGGFRLYQSYNDNYGNKAWLSTSVDGLFANKDILVNQKVKNIVNDFVKQLTAGQFNITTVDNANSIPENFKPFARYVRDYNETIAVNNFKRAWEKYGKGQIISESNMDIFIRTLANMTSYLSKNANTASPFDEAIFNSWIDLFGAPDLVHYPSLPNNAITSMILPKDRVYRFEVKTTILKSPNKCAFNAAVVNARYSPIKQFLCNIFNFWCGLD